MAKTKTSALTVSLEPYTGKDDGLSILAAVQAMAVTSKESCELLLADIKRWKQENREIEDFYDSPKDGMVKLLYTAYVKARDMRDAHLRPRKLAIEAGEKLTSAWNREAKRLEQEEADRRRREAEEQERQRRAEEAAKAEEAALALEASSNVLSEREQRFVEAFSRENFNPTQLLMLVKRLGYANPEQQAKRLLTSEKIQQAITNAQKAAAIRREAEAKQAAPIMVETQPVESQVAKVAGVSQREYYSCGEVDLRALVLAVAEDIQHGDGTKIQALQANMVFLNAEARSLKSMFSRVWSMCQLVKREGVAG